MNDKNPLDKRIIHYSNQSELAPVELNILKNLSEQRFFLKEWQDEKDKLYPEYLKGDKEPSANIIKEKSSTPLKTKVNNKFIFDDVESNKQAENKDKNHEEDSDIGLQINLVENNSCKETPQKRMELFEKFGIETPSPLVKQSKVTQEEMKQLSIAVHLWAENKYGSVNLLQQVRLKEKDFKDVVDLLVQEQGTT